MKTILRLLVSLPVICFIAMQAMAFPLTVYLIPKSSDIRVVALDLSTRREYELSSHKASDPEAFAIDTSLLASTIRSDSPFLLVDLLARKGDNSLERISLRMPMTGKRPASFSVRMILSDPEISPKTIEKFQLQGLSEDSDFTIFFQSRKMYRKIQAGNPHHPLIVAAAKWYFDSAYELARAPSSMVVMDEQSIVAAEDILSRAKSEKPIAHAFLDYSIDKVAWAAMIGRARNLEWKDARLIEENARAGDFAAATAYNDHFTRKFSSLGSDQKTTVAREWGINGTVLRKNLKYLVEPTRNDNF